METTGSGRVLVADGGQRVVQPSFQPVWVEGGRCTYDCPWMGDERVLRGGGGRGD